MARGWVQRRGGVFRVMISGGYAADGRRVRLSETVRGTKADAERKLVEMLAAVDGGAAPDRATITVGAYLGWWLENVATPRTAPRTWLGYETLINKHLLPRLGRVRLAKLQVAHVERLVAELIGEGLHPRTVRGVVGLLRQVLKHGVRRGLLGRNVAGEVELPKLRRAAIVPPDEAALLRLLDVARERLPEFHVPMLVAAHTGARRGEVLGLRWADVDLDARRVSVAQSVQRIRGMGLVVQTPKTASGRRMITIDDELVAALREHRARQAELRLRRGSAYVDRGFVFADADGAPLDPGRMSNGFRDVARAAGLPGVRLHDLRHAHASVLLAAGTPARVISQRLGHSSPAFTMTVYAHLLPGADEAAAAAFGERMRQVR